MTTYNGERYIYKQLISVLSQIGIGDEVIISDDSSTDATIDIIKNLNDIRIKLFENCEYFNPISNFENALRHASGDVIFLADQDDIWLPNKIGNIMNIFNRYREVTLVISDLEIINERDEIISASFFRQRGGFNSGILSNIYKNKFIGCSVAFRKTIYKYILPFPKDIPMHDMWIGIVSAIYGKVYYIDEQLMQYRRHSNNVSSLTHAPFLKSIRWRLSIIKNIIKLIKKYGLKSDICCQ